MIRPSACQAHPGRQVVKAEQLLERVGVFGALFHLVQQLQLPLKQRLVAPGQAAEHEADPLPQPRLVDRRLHGRPLDHRERLRGLGHLTRARTQVQRGRLGRHVHLVAGAQAADHAGQPLAGQHSRRAAQPGQLAADPVAEPEQQDGRHDDRDEPGAPDQDQAEQDNVPGVRLTLGYVEPDGGLRGRQLRDGGSDAGLPGRHAYGKPRSGGGRDDLVLECGEALERG